MFRRLSLVTGHWSMVFVWSLVIGHPAGVVWSFAAEVASPLSPADAQKAFVLADSNLKIELAAAEPEVIDPVAIRFDEDGRMWVVEMRDYPLGNPSNVSGNPSGGEPLSRIRVLEDKDADGRFESSTTFADKLLFVTGLQPWKGGVFVTLSGRLAYMKDTDSDGRADLDETWFEGFAELNSQLRANHPRLALDNWIYVANGLRGGKVVNKKLGQTEPINISGMDFRFNPLTGACEAVSGNGQFGLCFDDWGNRFNCSNRNPVRHVVIEDRYLKANPNVTVPATVNDVAAFGEQSRIFPISRAWTTSNLHAGQFTAACGVYVYRGDLLPAEFKGNVFTCDPTGNLIHREIMQPAGPTFTSKPAYEGKEFLCSPDEWFRPVNMELGPDGALYVVDMYRCVIEHPDFVPDELKKRPDQRLGDDRGRIWRIVPIPPGGAGTTPQARSSRSPAGEGLQTRRRPALSTASSEFLVPLLEHPNAWQRETAQRLLLEREWRPVGDSLAKIAAESPSPRGRMHALSLLNVVGKLDQTGLGFALHDSDPHVRDLAYRLAESTGAGEPRISGQPPPDVDPRVRFQSRLTLSMRMGGGSDDAEKMFPVALTIRDADDPWQRFAIRYFLDPSGCFWLLSGIMKWPEVAAANSSGMLILASELSEQLVASDLPGARPSSLALQGASALETNPPLALAALKGGFRGLARRKISLTDVAPSSTLDKVRQRLATLISDTQQDATIRRDTIELVGYLPDSTPVLLPLLDRKQDQRLRIAAISALARQPGKEQWDSLLAGFASDTPPIRRAIVDAMLTNSDRTTLLLDVIEAGRIKANELDLLQARRLTES